SSLPLELDVVAVYEVVEIRSRDVQLPRSLRPVSVRPLERLPHHPALTLMHGLLVGQGSIRRRRATRRAREDVSALDLHRILELCVVYGVPDSVLELSHVARPLGGLDRAQGIA